ncbi:MAG: DUF2079 domain-containing protein [Chlamydiae bacterium]|nr:DUF2079 domain-containing protein [Chlamydiota bacterium]MBI3265949.1 DUF2079 domain-containing protein [Chlamydiota bacterium]
MQGSRLFEGFRKVLAIFFLLASLIVLVLLLHGDYAAFTWRKFVLSDYGKYTNMVWNCAHGAPFKYLLDYTYLSTHLSFILLFFGPLFWVWDHPFLLVALQWFFLFLGALMLFKTALREKIRIETAAALILFYVANPFTQAVILCEFHGVGLYFFLVPWLYDTLLLRKKWTWLPFTLLLLVREDSGLMVAPLLFYFAVKDRWKGGYFFAALAIGYSFFAIHFLFEWLGGINFFTRRGPVRDLVEYQFFKPEYLWIRAKPLLWYFASILPFFWRRGSLPLLIIPSAALMQLVSSKIPEVYRVEKHYPVALISCSAVALLEAMVQWVRRGKTAQRGYFFEYALFLFAVTLGWHLDRGFLRWGRYDDRVYRVAHPEGEGILEAAQHIPKKGILLCPSELAGFCANRADLMCWEVEELSHYQADYIFIREKDIKKYHEQLKKMSEGGKYHILYQDHGCLILERGSTEQGNRETLESLLS